MTLTEKHIECAHLYTRLEVAGQDMAKECRVTRSTILQLVQSGGRRQDGPMLSWKGMPAFSQAWMKAI